MEVDQDLLIEAKSLMNIIKPPTQIPYSTSIVLSTCQFKVFPLDGTRIYMYIKNNKIERVYSNKKVEVNERVRIATIGKLNALFGSELEKLGPDAYIFNIVYNIRSLTILDVLYLNGHSMLEETWKTRILNIKSIGFTTPARVKIIDETPTAYIDMNNISGQLLVRDLYAFACYEKEYIMQAVEQTCKYLIVGEALHSRECRVYVPKQPYTKVSDIPIHLQKTLLELSSHEITFDDYDAMEADDKLTLMEALRVEYVKHQQQQQQLHVSGATEHDKDIHIKCMVDDKVHLIAAKNDHYKLTIFGYAKITHKNPLEIQDQRMIISQSDIIEWCNTQNAPGINAQNGSESFVNIRFHSPLYLVECKKVSKYRGLPVCITINDIKSYHNIAYIDKNHQIFYEVDRVPEIQTSKDNNTITSCSYNRVANELMQRIENDNTTNPSNPDIKRAKDYASYLIRYGAIRENLSNNQITKDQQNKRKLELDHMNIVNSLAKRQKIDDSNSSTGTNKSDE